MRIFCGDSEIAIISNLKLLLEGSDRYITFQQLYE